VGAERERQKNEEETEREGRPETVVLRDQKTPSGQAVPKDGSPNSEKYCYNWKKRSTSLKRWDKGREREANLPRE